VNATGTPASNTPLASVTLAVMLTTADSGVSPALMSLTVTDEDAVAGYRELITGNGGELVHEENWGLTKLAYPIQKKGTGFYHLFEFKANPEFIKSFELVFRRDERILRYLTVKLDRWGVDFNQRKRNGELRTVTPQGTKVVAKKKIEIEEDEL